MTLLEVLIALPILAMVMGMFSSTMISMYRQRAITRQTSVATRAIQSQLERLRNEPLGQAWQLYNRDELDDPDGPGTAPGAWFDVRGLSRLPDTPDVPVGELLFPDMNVSPPGEVPVWQLREDVDLPFLGMPRDLNHDYTVDSSNHANDYFALPVAARVRWQGPTGPREVRMYTVLVPYGDG